VANGKNPFRISYLSVALLCCLILGISFSVAGYRNVLQIKQVNDQKKVEVMVEDLEAQLYLMKKIGLQLSINNTYQPRYFKVNKYRERELLENFEQYHMQVSLSKECFLYYGEDFIFHSSGKTKRLDLYLSGLLGDGSTEIGSFLDEVLETQVTWNDQYMISENHFLFVFIPIRVSNEDGLNRAVLGFVIEENTLEERFQMVSGGISGKLSMYGEKGVLYYNSDEPCTQKQKKVLSAESINGRFGLCYLPENNVKSQNSIMMIWIILGLVDLFLVFAIANVYADKAYKPIKEISSKYKKSGLFSDEVQYANALKEIESMMDHIVESNSVVDRQIRQKQQMLKEQILHLLIDGGASFNVEPYLEKMNIRLPGPFFYVIHISYEKEKLISDDFFSRLQVELELLYDAKENNYIYAIYNVEKKWINVIVSLSKLEDKDDLTELVKEIAGGFSYVPLVGVGNTYESLSGLSISQLESTDNINENKLYRDNERQNVELILEEFNRISWALENGEEADCFAALQRAVDLLKGIDSLLMQQYIYTEFMGEISRQARKKRIELSNQSISLVAASGNIDSFKMAADCLIRDILNAYQRQQEQLAEEEERRIFEYINMHFSEYDITLESVAAKLQTSTSAVRQAVLKYSGKMYKDYLISLRIDYAKELLLKENMTVDEICQEVGYSSISYFTRLFKDFTGMTPAKYRKVL